MNGPATYNHQLKILNRFFDTGRLAKRRPEELSISSAVFKGLPSSHGELHRSNDEHIVILGQQASDRHRYLEGSKQ